ncbi:M48 family metallopeptidase [Dokdonella soli]|uniref:M48 family metallopeptidase n=1 Tax=Dokdonella soli TaxID=529810 RepID=A0ABP3TY71_9GAMM
MWRGQYFDGRSSRAHAVEVAIERDDLVVRGADVLRRAPLVHLRLSPRLGRTPRAIAFADRAQLVIDDDPTLDAHFASTDRVQSWADRLERRWKLAAVAVLLCFAASVFAFEFGVPWVAERIAMRMPAGVEASIGRGVLDQLDGWLLKPSTLAQDRQDTLVRAFHGLLDAAPNEEAMRVVFRDAPGVGANAFALPGGTIVVTDQLVALLGDDREFLAVAAHELGHERHRHALRQALQGSVVAVVAAMMAGDVSSASTLVVAMPTFLLNGRYSRRFESEADEAAFATLAAHGISPRWFATIMRKLEAKHPDAPELAYLSSHPPSVARIACAEQRADEFDAAQPPLHAGSGH